jgi:putative membrane protein
VVSRLGWLGSEEEQRTDLAAERTQLAWWRTGLTALAVGIAVGRIVPEVGHSGTRWPYAVLGVAFSGYGLCLIAYGHLRGRRAGAASEQRWSFALTSVGVLLAVATMVLIIAGRAIGGHPSAVAYPVTPGP